VIILFGEFWQPGKELKKVLMRDIILCLLDIAKTYFMPKSYGYLEKQKGDGKENLDL
jgi:hypothetical protein